MDGAQLVLSRNGSLDIETLNCDENGVPAVTEDLIGFTKDADGGYRIATGTAETHVINAGDVVIKGLDDATDYYIYETKAPDGYNLLSKPVKFRIKVVSYNQNGTAVTMIPLSIDDHDPIEYEEPIPEIKIDIENKSGATLPETGGMGTTLFYVLGAILVLAAVILLVTRKRMSSREE